MNIKYFINKEINIDIIIDLFYRSEYLPINDMTDKGRLLKMFTNANLIISAWENDQLIGIARSLCDYSYCCYLSDICVDKNYRERNIGKELIFMTKKEAGDECKLILHSSKDSIDFYKAIGMTNITEAFIIQRKY
jgi:predicted GNAT family N-acyltransferase